MRVWQQVTSMQFGAKEKVRTVSTFKGSQPPACPSRLLGILFPPKSLIPPQTPHNRHRISYLRMYGKRLRAATVRRRRRRRQYRRKPTTTSEMKPTPPTIPATKGVAEDGRLHRKAVQYSSHRYNGRSTYVRFKGESFDV